MSTIPVHWESGFLHYATARLMAEYAPVDPLTVLDALQAAIAELPVDGEAPAEGGGAMLLRRARFYLETRLRQTA